MEFFILAWFFLLGALIGSFLNVVIVRTASGESFGGRSRCCSCGVTLRWYELIPLVSWVLQRGRCRSCDARVSLRYPLVELATALLFIWIVSVYGLEVALLPALGVGALLIAVLVYDLEHTEIPDTFTLTLFPLTFLLALASAPSGALGFPHPGALLGVLVPTASLGALWYVSRGRWIGFGDVKLVAVLGLVLGLGGGVSLVLFAFWIGALAALALLALQWLLRSGVGGKPRLPFLSHSLTMKSEVPFAPFIVIAFFLVWLANLDALALISSATNALLGA